MMSIWNRASDSQRKDLQDNRASFCIALKITVPREASSDPKTLHVVVNLVCSDPLNHKVQHMTPDGSEGE